MDSQWTPPTTSIVLSLFSSGHVLQQPQGNDRITDSARGTRYSSSLGARAAGVLPRSQDCSEDSAVPSGRHWAHYGKTRRHPQNRKHVNYRNGRQRRTETRPGEGNKHREFSEVRTRGSWESDRGQTDRQTHRHTRPSQYTAPLRGERSSNAVAKVRGCAREGG